MYGEEKGGLNGSELGVFEGSELRRLFFMSRKTIKVKSKEELCFCPLPQ